MSEQRDTLENSPGMMKAFENAGIVEDNSDTGNETQSGSDTQGGDTNAGADQTDKIQGDAGKDSLSSKPDGGKKQGKEEKGKDAVDPNDLKLPDGSVVKAGAERRHYETAKIAQQRLGLAQTELATLKTDKATLETKYNELSSTVKQLGFEDPTQVTSAITLYKDLARDPKGTMTKLLAEMKAMGHTFEGVGGTIDTTVLQQLLDARLPRTSQEQQRPTQEQVNEQAAKDVHQFVTQFPDAITHEAHIAALIDRSVEIGKPLSLSDAYFALKERVVADGFDWSKDLGPQIEARKQSQQQVPQKPRTPGRVTVDANPVDPSKVVQPERDMDSDSIVLAAMKENGFQFNR